MYLIIFGILGLGLGSFINAWVWRTRQSLDDDGNPIKLSKAKKESISILKGRSMCTECKHSLSAVDLIPVFSWLYLGGKCRYCRKHISAQYPIVELSTAILFIVSYMALSPELAWEWTGLLTWLAGLVGLIALAVYDARWYVLPNSILRPIYIIVGIGIVAQFILGRPLSDIWGIIAATIICSGLFGFVYWASKGKWIGGGDVNLGLLTGPLIATAIGAFISLFFASIAGLIWAIVLMIKGKAKATSPIPFGPFLIAGAIIAVLYGNQIISWYESLIYIGL
jgi:prepilin signal peptidase PulO-like enzyme (type II secretory pathway)